MMSYKQGDVVLIPFPFSDLSTIKQRPALIISSNAYNKLHEDVIICAITSHVLIRSEDFDILLHDKDSQMAGLFKTSLIKCDKIITINKKLIRKFLGTIPPAIIQNIQQKILKLIN